MMKVDDESTNKFIEQNVEFTVSKYEVSHKSMKFFLLNSLNLPQTQNASSIIYLSPTAEYSPEFIFNFSLQISAIADYVSRLILKLLAYEHI